MLPRYCSPMPALAVPPMVRLPLVAAPTPQRVTLVTAATPTPASADSAGWVRAPRDQPDLMAVVVLRALGVPADSHVALGAIVQELVGVCAASLRTVLYMRLDGSEFDDLEVDMLRVKVEQEVFDLKEGCAKVGRPTTERLFAMVPKMCAHRLLVRACAEGVVAGPLSASRCDEFVPVNRVLGPLRHGPARIPPFRGRRCSVPADTANDKRYRGS
jgi:hypothetical protein